MEEEKKKMKRIMEDEMIEKEDLKEILGKKW